MKKRVIFIGSLTVLSALLLFGCSEYKVWTVDEEAFVGQGTIKSIDKNEDHWSLNQQAVCNKMNAPYIIFMQDINGKEYPRLLENGENFKSYVGNKVSVEGKVITKAATLCDEFANCIAPECDLLAIDNINLIEG